MSTDSESPNFTDLGFGPYPVSSIGHFTVALADGCRLAGKLWLPWIVDRHEQQFGEAFEKWGNTIYTPNTKSQNSSADSTETFPVILEYLPYVKDYYTANRDHNRHPFMTSHGFIVARFDMRGSGSSDGFYYDEYEPQEQQDCIELIDWLASQPWCNGRVGMYGKSWGGFNGLQVAYHNPPALKAVITLYSTDDRFNNDIYYGGNSVLPNALPVWCNQMFLWNARAPMPRYFDTIEEWRRTWLDRLENTGKSWMQTKLEHQTKDDYWKHGSIGEDYSRIKSACLVIGGLSDPYLDSAFRMSARLNADCRGLVGPWSHDWPDVSTPGPNLEFTQMCLQWWNWHLKPNVLPDGENVIDVTRWPRFQLFMRQAHEPREMYESHEGDWISLPNWPEIYSIHCTAKQQFPPPHNPNTGLTRLGFRKNADSEIEIAAADNLDQSIPTDTDNDWQVIVSSPYQCTDGGEWCAFTGAELAGNQAPANRHCTRYQSVPLETELAIAGQVCVYMTINNSDPDPVVSDRRVLLIRLCHIYSPTETTLIAQGHLNLIGQEPICLTNQVRTYRIDLAFTTYMLPKGACLELAISPHGYPIVMPSAQTVIPIFDPFNSWILFPTVDMNNAMEAKIKDLPPKTRDLLRAKKDMTLKFAEPEVGYKMEKHEIDEKRDEIQTIIQTDMCNTGCWSETGSEWRESCRNTYAINPSCTMTSTVCESTHEMRILANSNPEIEQNIQIRAINRLNSDDKEFEGQDKLLVILNGQVFFERCWKYSVPRK